jgi:cell wall assembly regulator SMI1
MKEIWNKIETWLSKNAANVLLSLADGATDEEIARAEEIMEIKFTEDFKASYRIHNGQKGNANTGFINGWDFLSLIGIVSEWQDWVDMGEFNEPFSKPEKGIKNDWFNNKWLPLTSNGNSDHHCLDLDPDQDGKYGQIIMLWHDDPLRSLQADNFTEFLSNFADDLENGGYLVDEKYGLSLS